MTTHVRVIWFALAALPYLSLVGVDTWMHEAARQVPRAERIIHWTLAPLLIGFLLSAFLARIPAALCFLAPFVVLLVIDALGFHGSLGRNERRVHAAAYVALAVFVATWAWVDLRA